MNASESQKTWLAQGLFLFLFIAIIWVAIKLAAISLVYVWILTIALLVVGLPCLVGGAFLYGRYKDIYDYEPTTLFGRSSNGKTVRAFLRNFVFLGFLSLISSGTLFVLIQTGVIE